MIVSPAPRHSDRCGLFRRRVRAVVTGAALCAAAIPGVGTAWAAVPAEGETAAENLFAPSDFDVVDEVATALVFSKAGEPLPVVVRQDAVVGDAVVAHFLEIFLRTRDAFADSMEQRFGARVLGQEVIGSAAFRDFRNEFQATNGLFPVSLVQAQAWARGFQGDRALERISSVLRLVMRDNLIGDVRPASTVFLVSGDQSLIARSWGEVAARASVVSPGSVITLSEAGERLRRACDPADAGAAGFLSGLLRPNVREDAHLTALLLWERLGERAQVRHVLRGEQLAFAGQPVARWSALALRQIERSGMEPPREPLEGIPVEPARTRSDTIPVPWFLLCVGSVLLVVSGAAAYRVAVLVRRRRNRSSMLPAVRPTAQAPETTTSHGVLPHLARELKDRLVRALFTQRSVLLENEQAASRRVAEMEERLARLQPAIAEKIRGYEQRITALEKELAEKDAETRDLIRAKLVLARKELDEEITRNRIRWN